MVIFHKVLALRVTSCLFRLALQGYSVALLPRRFALRARILGCFAPSHFALRAHENFQKKSVSQSTQNGLKRIEMPKTFCTPLTHYALCTRFAPSGFALRSLGLSA